MSAAFADPVARRIAAFLERIGIDVLPARLEAPTFLPGIALDRGRLLVDEADLTYPGDMLHEAGHVALVPARLRAGLSGDAELPGVDMAALEAGVVPWSYAAALEAGVDPAIVFHEGGYRGKSEGLLRTFGFGVYPGLPLLVDAGLTEPGTYPRMLRWLRA